MPQRLLTIPTPEGELTLFASDVRMVRRNTRKATKVRDDGSIDYGVMILFYDPIPAGSEEKEYLQIWFTNETARDVLLKEVADGMANSEAGE